MNKQRDMSRFRRVLMIALISAGIGLTSNHTSAQCGAGGGVVTGGHRGGNLPYIIPIDPGPTIKTGVSFDDEPEKTKEIRAYPSIPAELIQKVQEGMAIDNIEEEARRDLIQIYLKSNLPIPQFAVPTDLMKSVPEFTNPQKQAIGKLIQYLNTFPPASIESANALHIGNLHDSVPMPDEFDWHQLDIALRYAIYNAVMRNVPLEKVRFLTASELKSAGEERRKSLTYHYSTGSTIEIYPVSVDEHLVVEVVFPKWLPSRTSLFVTWGDPAGGPDKGELPVVNPRVSAGLFAVSEAAAYAGKTSFEQSGEPAFCGDGDRPCFLSTVALHDQTSLVCTGILITSNKILTAAHCVCKGVPSLATIGNNARLGIAPTPTARLTIALDPKPQYIDPEFCQKYSKYPNSPSTYVDGDLAVVTMPEGIKLDPKPPFAVLAAKSRLPEMSQVEVAGFGAREADPLGGEKYYASVFVASAECDRKASTSRNVDDKELYGCNPGRELVAIDRSEWLADTCYGDSGAGAHVRLRDDTYVTVGIVSRGLEKTCGNGGIYTLVTTDRVKDWLNEVAPNTKFETGETPLTQSRPSRTIKGG